MENAKVVPSTNDKGTIDNVIGNICTLPEAEQLIKNVKRHFENFVNDVQIAFKKEHWRTTPVTIPTFESLNDNLNYLISEGIVLANVITINPEIAIFKMEQNITNLLNLFEAACDDKNSKKQLEGMLISFKKLIKDLKEYSEPAVTAVVHKYEHIFKSAYAEFQKLFFK